MYSSSRLMRASISTAGRCQFSWLKANRLSTPTFRVEAALDHLADGAHAGVVAERARQRPALPTGVAVHDDAMLGGHRSVDFSRRRRSSLIRQTSMISASLAWIRPSIWLDLLVGDLLDVFLARVLSSSGHLLELL